MNFWKIARERGREGKTKKDSLVKIRGESKKKRRKRRSRERERKGDGEKGGTL